MNDRTQSDEIEVHDREDRAVEDEQEDSSWTRLGFTIEAEISRTRLGFTIEAEMRVTDV